MVDARAALRLWIRGLPVLMTIEQLPPNGHFPILMRRFERATVDEVSDVGSVESAAVSRRKQCEIRWVTSEFLGPRTVASSVATVALRTIAAEVSLPSFRRDIGRLELSLQNKAGEGGGSENEDQRDSP